MRTMIVAAVLLAAAFAAPRAADGPYRYIKDGKILAEVPIGGGVDATWFDPGTGYAFSSCSTGTVTIAHEDALDKLTVVQTLETATGARTMALDPATHRIYLAAAKYAPPPEGSPANARPAIVPGSMHLKIYGIDGK